MYTVEQIAKEIEQLKPDFTEFNSLLKVNPEDLNKHVMNTPNTFEKLFKAQLTLIMWCTHAHGHFRWSTQETFTKLLFDNVSNCNITSSHRSYGNQGPYYSTTGYYIRDSFKSYHIAAHITDVKPYLTPYLWNRVRVKSNKTLNFKELKPDLMALAIFSKHLSTLKKKLPSTQISIYIDQIRVFPTDIQQKYLKLLLGHSTPSLALQKKLTNFLPRQSSEKVEDFMYLNKCDIQHLVTETGMPTSASVLDDKESSYKPFITNVKRKPTPDLENFTYLFNAALILKASYKQKPNPVYEFFAEQISEHLKDPAYDEIKTKYFTSFNLLINSFKEVQDGLISI